MSAFALRPDNLDNYGLSLIRSKVARVAANKQRVQKYNSITDKNVGIKLKVCRLSTFYTDFKNSNVDWTSQPKIKAFKCDSSDIQEHQPVFYITTIFSDSEKALCGISDCTSKTRAR